MPSVRFFLVMMFIIPPVPSGSYFTDGFVIISMFWIVLAGVCLSTSLGSRTVGFPSIKTVNPVLPRNDTFPSISTRMEGTFSNTSTADIEAEVSSCPTEITFLSIWYSILCRWATTSTSSRTFSSTAKEIVPRSILADLFGIWMFLIISLAYPINLISA